MGSSGGMLNTRFPTELLDELGNDRTTTRVYDGQLEYAYAKRGQVILAERLAADVDYHGISIVSCHPGWVDTPGVEQAYGWQRWFLQPLRTPWEGVHGVCWLLSCNPKEIENGGFYLDCAPREKHLDQPGGFTWNEPKDECRLITILSRITNPY